MAIKIKEFPNLLMTKKVADTIKTDKALTEKAKGDIAELLYKLNEFGADKNYLGNSNFKKFRDGWNELRIKDGSNTWRILFRKLPESKMYGIVYLFLKQTDAITTKQWKTAKQIASQENWI